MLPTVVRPGVILICYVALWPFHVESCLALCSHVVVCQSCLALWSSRLGKRASLCASRAIFCVF